MASLGEGPLVVQRPDHRFAQLQQAADFADANEARRPVQMQNIRFPHLGQMRHGMG